jgi:hypothetical protein
MIDRETKMFFLIMTWVVVLAVPFVIWLCWAVEEQSQQCRQQGGVVLKSLDGWKCFDVKAIK